MWRWLSLAVILGSVLTAPAAEPVPAIIPKPACVECREGRFVLRPQGKIFVAGGGPELLMIGRQLAEILKQSTGWVVPVEVGDGRAPTPQSLLLSTVEAKTGLGEEGYELLVSPQYVTIRGAKPAGVFYGVQTLSQLLPAVRASSSGAPLAECSIPCLSIEDRPRFAWRGMHLDVARHFFSKEFVERYIDYLAAYKFNVFHLYLTDDQGWRIEIKRYPRLTEVGAWRSGTSKHTVAGPGDHQRYGGFYTQRDIREIVAYARQRFVTVVPGISMPGHCQAALASYPELSSTGGPLEVWTGWGISKNVMDPGKEEVFRFVEGVLSEVIELFPGPYLHTGGDEVPRDAWTASPYAQARMRQECLKNEDELQSYFTRRVERFLHAKGRRLVGWDEILEGGLPPGAVVMSWRGTAGGIAAARAKHDVVMTPNAETYFNFRQEESKTGPGHSRHLLPLLKAYHFDPTRGLTPEEARHILGGQGCLWTEYVPTPADVEYLLFPRLFAMAEALWSPQGGRRDEDFLQRLPMHLARLKAQGIRYCDGRE